MAQRVRRTWRSALAWTRTAQPHPAAAAAGVAAAYFLAAQPGLAVALPSGNVSALWPAAGVALAAALVFGRWGLAGAWVGQLLVNLHVFAREGQSPPGAAAVSMAAAVATGGTLEALLNCLLLRRWQGERDPSQFLQRVPGVFTFVAAAGVAASLSASVGTTALCLGRDVPWSDYGLTWCTWLIGDAIGVLLVTPLLLPRRKALPPGDAGDEGIASPIPDPSRRRPRAMAVEGAALLAVLVVLGVVVFELGGHPGTGHPPLAFLYIPVLLWAALRFGTRGAAGAVAVMSALALGATLNGTGPFARGAMHPSLLLLQLFVGAGALTALAMAAAVAEQRAAAAVVRRLNADLERRIAGRTSELEAANRSLRHEVARKAEILQSYLRDLAGRKRAEAALVQSEQRFRTAAASASDLIYDWDVATGSLEWFGDVDGRLGYAPGQFERTIDAWERMIHPEDRARVAAALEHSVKTGAPFRQEYRVIRNGGGVGYWTDRGEVVRPESGAAGGAGVRFIGAVADVTARTVAEAALRDTDARLRRQNAALVDLTRRHAAAAGDFPAAAAALTEAAARTLGVERASLWLFNAARSGIRCVDLFRQTPGGHSAGAELQAAGYPAYFKALEQDVTIAAHDAHADPRTREFSAGYLSPLGIGAMLDSPVRVDGRTVGVLCCEHVGPRRQWTVDEQAFADSVTNLVAVAIESCDRRRAEQALLEHQKALVEQERASAERQQRAEQLERERVALKDAVAAMEQVLGVVGHELRTPLAAMRAISEFLITDDARHMKEWDEFLRNLNDEAVRMSDTVDALLEAARLNSGRARWAWSEFGLAAACEEALEPARALLDASRVTLAVRVEPPGARIRGDADAVRRLVTNLVTNARKHTPDGRIDVTARLYEAPAAGDPAGAAAERWAEIRVTDTGSGIPPEIVERLGEAFALNAGVVGARHVSGTGLGLAICKGIVQAHGGALSIESGVGRGTSVTVRLRADLEGPAKSGGKSEFMGAALADRAALTDGAAATAALAGGAA